MKSVYVHIDLNKEVKLSALYRKEKETLMRLGIKWDIFEEAIKRNPSMEFL